MKKENVSNSVAKRVVKVLDSMLKVEANSTSCVIVFQPKAPKGLEKFRRDKC